MPGIKVGRFSSSLMYPNTRDYLVAAAQTIYAGDWVVLSGANSTTRVRKLTSTDIGNNYTESAVVKGILGMALHDVATDSNGFATIQITPATVAGGVTPVYPLPSYAAGIDPDPQTGIARLVVALALTDVDFLVRYAGASNAAATVTPAVVDTQVGFQVANTIDFRINSGASGAGLCAIVVGTDEQDKNYNTSSTECFVFTRILPAYQQ